MPACNSMTREAAAGEWQFRGEPVLPMKITRMLVWILNIWGAQSTYVKDTWTKDLEECILFYYCIVSRGFVNLKIFLDTEIPLWWKGILYLIVHEEQNCGPCGFHKYQLHIYDLPLLEPNVHSLNTMSLSSTIQDFFLYHEAKDS